MQPIAVGPANLFRPVHFFDVLAAIVFAVSGALVASRKGLDVMAMVAGFVVPFTARGLAITFDWSLAVFRQSTKRER